MLCPIIRQNSLNNSPLVSILLQTHNRPDMGELALRSALSQSYGNIEIVISDNSDTEETRDRFQPYMDSNPCIKYHRVPGLSALENGKNCFRHATGEYINYLMDDDLFHPEKILRMMTYALASPKVGLVTSFRQLIDLNGSFMDPLPGTERLFTTETAIDGRSFGRMMLTNGQNLVGEPTTALFRRDAAGEYFGLYGSNQYVVLSDVANWLAVLTRYDCVYLPDALSYFRLHGGQDQRNTDIKCRANIEWIELLCEAIEQSIVFPDRGVAEELLSNKLVTCVLFLSSIREQIRQSRELPIRIQKIFQRSSAILFD
jgi:glycosyltransferase involved in cell wall biosynthesis